MGAGATPAIQALRAMLDRGGVAADRAVMAMADVYKASVREELSRASHAPGTPTPAPIGSPPAAITGALRDSIVVVATGPGMAQVGGTTPYARIQQLGGLSGRGLKTITPARPYLDPAWEACTDEARSAAIDVLAREIYG